jgi:hypothetical protein
MTSGPTLRSCKIRSGMFIKTGLNVIKGTNRIPFGEASKRIVDSGESII